MKRIGADQFYFFDNYFFKNFYFNLKANFVVLSAINKETNKVASSILVLFDNKIGYYFFSGKEESFKENSSINFLLHKSIIFLKRKKIKYFNLGGGNSDSKNDPLFKFKNRISKDTKDFYIGKKIHDKLTYFKLTEMWCNKHPNSKNSNKFLKYRFS